MVTPIDDAARAQRVWLKILRKPVSVVMTRPGTLTKGGKAPDTILAAQTVRVALDNRPTEVVGVAGSAPRFQATVYGVRDHPDAAVTDTDIEEGYTFDMDGDHYRCVNVKLVPGGKQATCVVNG